MQGIPFFYPFSSRPCVIPGNPAMRLRTNDLRSEAVIFILFCALILFCWPLFGAGFWQKYNETFMNYSHIQREAKRKDDILQITFLDANKDSVTAKLIDYRENTFEVYSEASLPSLDRNGWASYYAKECKFLAFTHTGIPLRTKRFQVFNVSPDSIKHYLRNPLIEMQLQCTQEMYYYEGAVLKSGKTITKDYTEGFDFYIEQSDNSERQAEIQTLQAQISQERQIHQDQLNELNREQRQLRADLNEGNRTYRRLSDFKKGQWLRQRPKLKADMSQLTAGINHLRPPNLQADYHTYSKLKIKLKPP
jgi:inner membrane protein